MISVPRPPTPTGGYYQKIKKIYKHNKSGDRNNNPAVEEDDAQVKQYCVYYFCPVGGYYFCPPPRKGGSLCGSHFVQIYISK